MARIKLYQFLGAFSQSREASLTFVTHVLCLFARVIAAPIGRISVKFDIWDLSENMPINSKFYYNWTKI